MPHRLGFARAAAVGALFIATPALAQGPDSYLGTIYPTAGTYCPQDTVEATGQILPISEYQALYAYLGNVWGGDGISNFALPDLRGRGLVAWGQGTGLSPIPFGQPGGAEQTSLTITQSQMPQHSHDASANQGPSSATLSASSNATATNDPKGATFATFAANQRIYAVPSSGTSVPMATLISVNVPTPAVTVAPAGLGQPIPLTRNPYVGIRYCIVVYGIFPPRPD